MVNIPIYDFHGQPQRRGLMALLGIFGITFATDIDKQNTDISVDLGYS